ncbi:hypothetical protein JOM56_013404 [Amanita muscaria]
MSSPVQAVLSRPIEIQHGYLLYWLYNSERNQRHIPHSPEASRQRHHHWHPQNQNCRKLLQLLQRLMRSRHSSTEYSFKTQANDKDGLGDKISEDDKNRTDTLATILNTALSRKDNGDIDLHGAKASSAALKI